MNRLTPCLALLASVAAGTVIAQSTGGFSPSSSGSAAAGGSPVGTVLPYTVQSGSTAPTLPGHAITAENRPTGTSWPASTSTGKVMAGAARQTALAGDNREPENRSVASRNDVQGFDGFSFHDIHDDAMDSHVLAWASAAKRAIP